MESHFHLTWMHVVILPFLGLAVSTIGTLVGLGGGFILIPVLSIASMAPSIGGLGVREAAIIYLFKHYMPNERALALSLLLDMLIYALSFAGGILYAFKGGLKARVMHEMEEINP